MQQSEWSEQSASVTHSPAAEPPLPVLVLDVALLVLEVAVVVELAVELVAPPAPVLEDEVVELPVAGSTTVLEQLPRGAGP